MKVSHFLCPSLLADIIWVYDYIVPDLFCNGYLEITLLKLILSTHTELHYTMIKLGFECQKERYIIVFMWLQLRMRL